MPKPPLILRIPNPCTQGWETMQPTGCGRHCDAFNKTVIDFTNFSDDELITFFNSPKNKNVCGHIWSTQLNRPLVKSASLPAWFKLRWQKAAAFVLLFQAVAYQSWSQKVKKQSVTMVPVRLAAHTRLVTGRLLNWSTRQPIPGITIVFCIGDVHSIMATTGTGGYFELKLPKANKQHIMYWEEQVSPAGTIMAGNTEIATSLLTKPFEVFFRAAGNRQLQATPVLPLEYRPRGNGSVKYIVDGIMLPPGNNAIALPPASINPSPIPVRRIDITPKPRKK